MEVNEGDLVFCKVTGIQGASVFLEIEGEKRPGTMIMSEVAAGRIRNLREYVSPGRKVVCKVLRIASDHVELSLRRVTAGEREKVLKDYKKERAFASVLKVVGESPEKIISKIKEKYEFVDFVEQARENPELFEEFVDMEKAKKIAQIVKEKEVKEKTIVRKFVLKTESEKGVSDLKEVLDFPEDSVEIHYLGSGSFAASVSGKDLKDAGTKTVKILEEIGERAKKKKAFFEILKEKS